MYNFIYFYILLIVAGTANAGFNIVLTAFLNAAWVYGAYHVIEKSKTPIAVCRHIFILTSHSAYLLIDYFSLQVGFLIGSSCSICALDLITSVYWGQLSKCEKLTYSVSQYSCSNKTAYGAVCAFAVLLFLCQFAFSVICIMCKGELIDEVSSYDDISSAHNTSMPYENIPKGEHTDI